MSEPWLTFVGLGEDGLAGLTDASRKALDAAEIVFGGQRHLALVGAGARGHEWPLPFSVAPVLAQRGRNVAVLASGDPFWHGAGGALMPHLQAGEWQSYPAPSTFALLANLLGWKLEETTCLGLHAAPLTRLRPYLTHGARIIVLLRDGNAVTELVQYLQLAGAGRSTLHVGEALGGPAQRIQTIQADQCTLTGLNSLVVVGVEVNGPKGLPRSCGLPDALFRNDGQITRSPVRAITLSALAPRQDEILWDIGAGSGSVSVEWCLAGGKAIAIEKRADRIRNIEANIADFGLDGRMRAVIGAVSADTLDGLPRPDAVFVGGGATADLLSLLFDVLPSGTRLVINAVTLETETLLLAAHAKYGGSLLRIDLAQAAGLGRMRGWTASRPVVQWSVTR